MAIENNFEIIMVADANLTDEESQAVFDKFRKLIKNLNGEIKFENSWGRRRLAYEINKKQFGIFQLLYVKGNGALVEEVERQFGYDEKILKFFIMAVDDLEKEYNDFEALKADPNKNANLVKEAMGA
ncbi:30S ribosomal protein S6 [bacterium]|nr:30S ribosomal protein S6 [bacterium]